METKNKTDVSFRRFLLELLLNRELTSLEIWGRVRFDYYRIKRISRQYLENTLKKLTVFHLVSRKRIKKREDPDDKSRFIYTTTDYGRKKIRYYASLQQKNEYGV